MTILIFCAGVLMGVFERSGMANAIAMALVSVIPEAWGGNFTLIIALVSGPGLWILNNDAFYFGVLPVLAETASAFGFTDMQIAVASLIGQNLRAFSPVIPSLYFLASYVGVEFAEYQKKVIPFAVLSFILYLAVGALMGVYTLAG